MIQRRRADIVCGCLATAHPELPPGVQSLK